MSDCHFSILARDDSRILARVAGLIARLGLALKSMSMVSSDKTGICRMSIVLDAEPAASDLLCRLLSRLVDVRTVEVRRSPIMYQRKKPRYRGMATLEATLKTALPVNA